MDVTLENFNDLLPEIEESIEKCSFMAIDCELSGLRVTDDKENCFETVEERYQSVRDSASEFLVIQFGLVPFFYDSEKDAFTHKAYNFYTFPRQSGRHAPNIRFLCESSSIEFLCSCGFDFNKLFYQGIAHLTYSGERKMREDLEKRQAYLASEDSSSPIPVPEYLKKFMEDTENKIKRFLASKLTEFELDNVNNAFHRKLIFANIKPKYGNKLYFETINQGAGTESADNSSVSESDKSDSETGSSGVTSILSSATKKEKSPKSSGISKQKDETSEKKPVDKKKWEKILRVTKVSEEELNALNEVKKQKELESIDQAIGFSKVIRKISQSGKIVVGHNMLLDVSHTISQFVDELPNNLADFKLIVQTAFPNVVDTKLMASTHPFRELMSSTVLFDLMKKLQAEPFCLPEITKASGEGYNFADEKRHEAGFDAFVTGVCFLGMCQYLGTLQMPKKPRVLPESPLVMPFINKIYMMRIQDVSYLNISGADLTPSRSHVFHVTCPKEAVTKNIQDLFSPFGPVQIYWQNEKSLFVALSDKDQAALVMRTIECKAEYRVIPFDQYQKKKRPLTGDSPEREGSVSKAVPTSKAGKSTNSNGGQKKKRPKTDKPSETKESKPDASVFDQPSTWD